MCDSVTEIAGSNSGSDQSRHAREVLSETYDRSLAVQRTARRRSAVRWAERFGAAGIGVGLLLALLGRAVPAMALPLDALEAIALGAFIGAALGGLYGAARSGFYR